MTVNTWRKARESADWVGPIACTLTDRSTGLPVPQNVKFAVLPKGTRPAAADWAVPYPDPDGTAGIGVWQGPVDAYQHLGIWAMDTDNPEIPVLEPDDVGWIIRT